MDLLFCFTRLLKHYFCKVNSFLGVIDKYFLNK